MEGGKDRLPDSAANSEGRPYSRFPVVGLGASAGGLEALQTFFSTVPPDLGVAFVVVVHLSPEHQSGLPSILGRYTTMRVTAVTDIQPLQVNTVYVITPDRKLEITGHSIAALPFAEPRGRRAPIDTFFRSLAEEHGDGFAVILSGGGSDGALGIRVAKAAGGIILVQDPGEAMHDAMPRAAIATGAADVVLPVSALASKLVELVQSKHRLPSTISQEFVLSERDEQALVRLLGQIRNRRSHDFTKYKRSTVLRRLVRRVQLRGLSDLTAYYDYVRGNDAELNALFDDLLISVTSFFRDPEAWQALEREVVGPLLERATEDRPIRAWVAGCSTGEEAYSLAISILEKIEQSNRLVELSIFASDLDEQSLATARRAIYPSSIAADVSDERLRRFFHQVGDRYQISRRVRDCVTFAQHNLLHDPPFSNVDLVTCRNVLTYLNRSTQEQLARVFRYACHPAGYLFLGLSETSEESLFRAIDKRNRVFQARDLGDVRVSALAPVVTVQPAEGRGEKQPSTAHPAGSAALHRELLETAAPPSLVVDARRHVVNLSETAGRYLRMRRGPLTRDVTELVRPELQLEVRARLSRAFERGEQGVSAPLTVAFEETTRRVSVFVAPKVRESGGEPFALVVFLEGGPVTEGEDAAHASLSPGELTKLREEMRDLEQQMETTLDVHQLANEELRAANEELQSLNEEYRSTAEELETSKEELQSINEELQAVNAELKLKLDEVSRTNDDLENLMAASDIGTLFLDRGLKIHRFTPRIHDLINLQARDCGRHIGDFTHRLDYDTLVRDAEHVLATLSPLQRRARSDQGRAYVIRLQAYRTVEDRIDGVVITFVDVTDLTSMEDKLRESERRLSDELAVSTRLYIVATRAVTATSSQQAFEEILKGPVELQRADFGLLHLIDETSGDLKLVATAGLTPLERPIEPARLSVDDRTAYGRCVRTRTLEIIEDVSAADPSAAAPTLLGCEYRALQAVPLISDDGTVHGAISVHFSAPRVFSQRDRRVLETLARQAANLLLRWRDRDRLTQLNLQLRQQAEELREVDARKAAFLSVLGHELRNPLAAISSAAVLLDERFRESAEPVDPESARMFEIVVRQSRHISRLVDDLLDLTRINQGKIYLDRRTVDLREAVRTSVGALHMRAPSAGFALEVVMPEDPVWIYADADRVMQIVDNLLANAREFSLPNGKIELRMDREDGWVLLRVRDHGRGMTPEVMARIFEPFFQATDRDRAAGGLGLGLAIVRYLVELHGGRITARSDGPNTGSEFIVQLPTTEAPPPTRVKSYGPKTVRRILVVDDQADVADAVAALLKSLGHRVYVAYNGPTALAIARKERLDVGLLDLAMPEMSGYVLSKLLRAELPGVRLLAMSGFGHHLHEGEISASNFERFLTKPPDVDTLVEILDTPPADASSDDSKS